MKDTHSANAEISDAARKLKDWLYEGAFLNGDAAHLSEQRPKGEAETLLELFLELAKKRGFSLGVASFDGRFVARWSHSRIGTARLPSASLVPTKEDAILLACSILLRDPECASYMAGI